MPTAPPTELVDPASAAESTPGGKPRPATWLLLYPLALFLNFRQVYDVFTPYGTLPLGTDSYYHLRRILAAIDHFPLVPNEETYLSFPDRAAMIWPFGFDTLYAAFALACTGGAPDQWWTVALSSVLTPLLGAFIPCFIFLLGMELSGPRTGFAASLLFCLLPISYTQVGYVDHHVFEPFWTALYLLLYLRALRHAGRAATRLMWLAFAAGLALTAGLLCTTILPLLFPLHVGVVLAQGLALARRQRTELPRLAVVNAVLFLTVSVALFPFVVTRVAEPAGVTPSITTSWGVAFVLAATALAASALWGRREREHRAPLMAGSALLVSLGAIALARAEWRPALDFVMYGVGHVFKKDPWLASIQESQGVLSLDLLNFFYLYSGFAILWPGIVCVMLWVTWRRSAQQWAVVVLALLVTPLAFLQLKFGLLFRVPFVLTLGLAWDHLFVRLETSGLRLGRMALPPGVSLSAMALAVLAVLAPTLLALQFSVPKLGESTVGPYLPAILWLRERTPPTSPSGMAPEDYAVVSDWQFGHWIVFLAERPVVGSPLGHPPALREAIRDGAAIFMLPPEQADDLMQRRRVRYLFMTAPDVVSFARLAFWDEKLGYPPDFDPGRIYEASLLKGLVADGVPLGQPSPDVFRHLRLVYESDVGTRVPTYTADYVGIFERVPGAEIVGVAGPGAGVTISGRVLTPGGRLIVYRDQVRAGADGRFAFRVPYATGVQRYSSCTLVDSYTVESGGRAGRLPIAEEDVLAGSTRTVQLK